MRGNMNRPTTPSSMRISCGIAPTVAGTLVQVADVDNRHVEAGRLLAVIEAAGPEAQRRRGQANVQQARRRSSRREAQVDRGAARRATRPRRRRARRSPTAQKAAQDLARYQALRADRSECGCRPAARSGARRRRDRPRREAAAARRQIDSADAQIAVARRAGERGAGAVIDATQGAGAAGAGDARRSIASTAPVSGQVVNRQVNLGSYVAPGTQLMAIVPDQMWVTANFKETQLALHADRPAGRRSRSMPFPTSSSRAMSIRSSAARARRLRCCRRRTPRAIT